MVTEGIVLGLKISAIGVEVNQAKVSMIETLMHLIQSRGLEVFWDMLDFIEDYQRLLKNFQTIMQTAREGCQV